MVESETALAAFLARAGSVTVLTGAGVSTASGIPGYRDRNGDWKHPAPVQFNDFRDNDATRRRYWARSFAGWRRIAAARPNGAHRALAELERAGFLDTLITQNVDGLHTRAGHVNVIELHGRLDTVRCLSCNLRVPRADWQQRLLEANPGWQSRVEGIRPDGDVNLSETDVRRFRVPDCACCGGIMKPDVVFFGESVPKVRVAGSSDAVQRAGALLVVGSSLMVYSGFRFARLARELGKPLAILNQGRTRADDIAGLRLDGDCGDMLGNALRHLDGQGASSVPSR